VTVGSGFPTAPTRVSVDVEIELWPSVPMGKQDLDVEGRSNIADSQYKSSVKFVAIKSMQLIMHLAWGFAAPQLVMKLQEERWWSAPTRGSSGFPAMTGGPGTATGGWRDAG
jgi:hypothetical protein